MLLQAPLPLVPPLSAGCRVVIRQVDNNQNWCRLQTAAANSRHSSRGSAKGRTGRWRGRSCVVATGARSQGSPPARRRRRAAAAAAAALPPPASCTAAAGAPGPHTAAAAVCMGTLAELSLQIWLGNGILAPTSCTAARPSVATPTLQRMRALKVALRLSCSWESIQWSSFVTHSVSQAVAWQHTGVDGHPQGPPQAAAEIRPMHVLRHEVAGQQGTYRTAEPPPPPTALRMPSAKVAEASSAAARGRTSAPVAPRTAPRASPVHPPSFTPLPKQNRGLATGTTSIAVPQRPPAPSTRPCQA